MIGVVHTMPLSREPRFQELIQNFSFFSAFFFFLFLYTMKTVFFFLFKTESANKWRMPLISSPFWCYDEATEMGDREEFASSMALRLENRPPTSLGVQFGPRGKRYHSGRSECGRGRC